MRIRRQPSNHIAQGGTAYRCLILPMRTGTRLSFPIPALALHAFLSHSFFAPFPSNPVLCCSVRYTPCFSLSTFYPCQCSSRLFSTLLTLPIRTLPSHAFLSQHLLMPMRLVPSQSIPVLTCPFRCPSSHAFLSQHLLMPMLFITLQYFADPTYPHLSKPCFSLSTFYPRRTGSFQLTPVHSAPFPAMLFLKGETNGSN